MYYMSVKLIFRQYVERSFASVRADQKDQMEELLKVKLTSVFTSDKTSVTDVDWESEPVPQ